MDWGKLRNYDGSIDLCRAYADKYGKPPLEIQLYFASIEAEMPIKSRQAAAIAIATARFVLDRSVP